MAHFDRVIPPGGEGEIKLSARTSGYKGVFRKKARVFTNDPGSPVVILEMQARVMSLIHVSSNPVYLYMKAGQSIERVVEIKAGLDKPLKLTPKQFDLSGKLAYTIEETEEGRTFKISLTNIPGPSKNYDGYLKFATNYPEKPEIKLKVYARFPREKQKRTAPDRKPG